MRISRGQLILKVNEPSLKRNKISDKKTEKKDEFCHNQINIYKLYKKEIVKKKKVKDSVLDEINFNYEKIFKVNGEKRYTIEVNGEEYLKNNLPKVPMGRCNKIKAVNNSIILNNNAYYEYTDNNGKQHIFSCKDNNLGQPYSDQIAGRVDKETYEISKFWNLMSKDGTYVGLYRSKEQIKSYLNDAGITNGFFSVQVGENRQEYFFSNGTAGIAIKKKQYDITYNMYTKKGNPIFNWFDVGDIIVVGGKEYLLKEDRTLDIPYGEDIYDIQIPKGKLGIEREKNKFIDNK